MDQSTRQSRTYRGHRIVAQQLGDTWTGIVHAPATNAIVETFEAASAQEVFVRAVDLVNTRLRTVVS